MTAAAQPTRHKGAVVGTAALADLRGDYYFPHSTPGVTGEAGCRETINRIIADSLAEWGPVDETTVVELVLDHVLMCFEAREQRLLEAEPGRFSERELALALQVVREQIAYCKS